MSLLVMPGLHTIATIATVVTVAVTAIAEKRKTSDRYKTQNSAIDITFMSAEIKAIWESLIAAIATIIEIEIFQSQRSQSLRSLQ